MSEIVSITIAFGLLGLCAAIWHIMRHIEDRERIERLERKGSLRE